MYYFRAEGSAKIGIGHLMRSMSVAGEFSCREEIIFLCHTELSAKTVRSRGFEVIELKSVPFSREEAEEIKNSIGQDDYAVIILDSYEYDNLYVRELSKFAKVVCFDDIAENAFDADVIINYNSYAAPQMYEEMYENSEAKLPELILGSEYIPLRKEFRGAKEKECDTVKDILITTGGGDVENLAKEIAEKLIEDLGEEKVNLHLVCGSMNPNYDSLKKLSETNKYIFIHKDVRNMAELMDKCDIAVSAGGSTCYELCAMGLPFTVFAYALNQTGILKDMSERGTALGAGYISSDKDREVVLSDIVSRTVKLVKDKELRDKMRKKGRELVDGKGAERLADMLCSLY